MCQKKILPEIIFVQWCHFKCVNSFTLLNPCSTDHSVVSPLCLFLPASLPICVSVTNFSQKHLICFFFWFFACSGQKLDFWWVLKNTFIMFWNQPEGKPLQYTNFFMSDKVPTLSLLLKMFSSNQIAELWYFLNYLMNYGLTDKDIHFVWLYSCLSRYTQRFKKFLGLTQGRLMISVVLKTA